MVEFGFITLIICLLIAIYYFHFSLRITLDNVETMLKNHLASDEKKVVTSINLDLESLSSLNKVISKDANPVTNTTGETNAVS